MLLVLNETSTFSVRRSVGSNVTVPVGPSNSPRTLDTTMWRTVNCAAEWPGSIVQVTVWAEADVATAPARMTAAANLAKADRRTAEISDQLTIEQTMCPSESTSNTENTAKFLDRTRVRRHEPKGLTDSAG